VSDAYFVLAGELSVETHEEEGGPAVTGFLRAEDSYMEKFGVWRYLSSSCIRATKPSVVLLVPLKVVQDVLLTFPEAMLQALFYCCDFTQIHRRRIVHLNTQPIDVVIGRALHELADINVSGTRTVSSHINQAGLASYVGRSREEVNKKMKELRSKGLLRKEGSTDRFTIDSIFENTTHS
jgi:CRP-like cAMP-binding protein